MSDRGKFLVLYPAESRPLLGKLYDAIHRVREENVRPGSVWMSEATWLAIQADAGIAEEQRRRAASARDRLIGYPVTTVPNDQWRGRESFIIMPEASAPPPGEEGR